MSMTGDALEALYDLLLALSELDPPKIPTPLQNESLSSRLQEIEGAGENIQMYLNVWDDSDGDTDELLGAAVTDDCYDITREVPIEFIVAGGTRETRRAAFEEGLAAVFDAIAADRTLDGTVEHAEMLAPRRNGAGLWIDGMPSILAAEARVRLTFTSNRTF